MLRPPNNPHAGKYCITRSRLVTGSHPHADRLHAPDVYVHILILVAISILLESRCTPDRLIRVQMPSVSVVALSKVLCGNLGLGIRSLQPSLLPHHFTRSAACAPEQRRYSAPK